MNSIPGQSQSLILRKLFSTYPFLKGDRFLESCFWGKALYHEKADRNNAAALDAIQEALKNGYPLPQVYNDQGVLLEKMGRKKEARQAFEKAIHSPLNLTPALENLKSLEQGSGPNSSIP